MDRLKITVSYFACCYKTIQLLVLLIFCVFIQKSTTSISGGPERTSVSYRKATVCLLNPVFFVFSSSYISLRDLLVTPPKHNTRRQLQ